MALRARARHLAAPLLLASAAAGVAIAAPATAAAADTLQATRGALVEKRHDIDIVLRPGHARLRVVREVDNRGDRHDQALFHIWLPQGAVATGLRTRGGKPGAWIWYEGELLDAEVAAARYRELTGIGGYYPKDPALLSWRDQDHLALQVFPCPPREEKAIGYDLDIPTTWVDGHERLTLPAMGLEGSRAVATLRTEVPGARILVEGHEVASGATVRIDGDRTIDLERPMRLDTVDGRLAAVPFGAGRSLVALRFEAPRRISEVPRSAHVVVAIDASRSMSVADLEASMNAAAAHLAHYQGRDARVAVLAYDRGVRELTRGFVGLDAALTLLDGAPPARGNGSAVDVALARAGEILAAAPAGAPRRIVVLHDLLARAALSPSAIAAPRGAVLHVADVSDGPGQTARDDDDVWSTLPRSTGGLLFRASAPSERLARVEDRAAIEAAFLEWARPVRVDRARWSAAGAEEHLGDLGELEEGDVAVYSAIQAKTPPSATLTGELWSRPLRKTLTPDAAEGKLWSALVFGSELLPELTEDEMKVLAHAGGAVSPVTSYLAIEPGVRPSTEGLDEFEGGVGQGIGLGGIGTIGHGSGGGGRGHRPDHVALFRDMMQEGVKRCGATGRAHVDAETTFTEVVDVTAKVTGDDPARTLARCVAEAAWALELPTDFDRQRLGIHVAM